MKAAQVKARIVSNKKLKNNYWHLEFESNIIARFARPGQFVNIISGSGSPVLLRRPVSVHGVESGKIKLFYEAVGSGTQALSAKRPGELLDVIGPLGNGFDLRGPAEAGEGENILIAGGMGVAPLVFLAEKLRKLKIRNSKIEIKVLIGARTEEQVLCAREFKALGCGVKLATDDGSVGFKGKVTDLLKQQLVPAGRNPAVIYACGPQLMLKGVSEIARENKARAQLSLEAHMACGIGACLGCVVLTKGGYKRVCKDGPVFSSQELIW